MSRYGIETLCVMPIVIVPNYVPPLEEIVALLLVAEPEQKTGDDVSHAHVVASIESRHVGKVPEGLFNGSRCIYLDESVSVSKPAPSRSP